MLAPAKHHIRFVHSKNAVGAACQEGKESGRGRKRGKKAHARTLTEGKAKFKIRSPLSRNDDRSRK